MRLTDQFLAELEREAARTRRTLEQVPKGKGDWKPHEKSMPLGRLAGLVATMPSWVAMTIERDDLDLAPQPGQSTYHEPETTPAALVDALDKTVAGARASLRKTSDDHLMTPWKLLSHGKVVMEAPRHVVLRDTFNHLAHHRGQLTVYLRLIGATVPAIYGPSADDQRFL